MGEAFVYRFGLFEIDSRSGELRKQNVRLRLRGRPIEILLILLETPGEVVTREDLRARLWPADTFVDFDHGLHSAVNRLRETLGDSAESPRFIETLPKRGYRFIAPVTVVRPGGPAVNGGDAEPIAARVPVATPTSASAPGGAVASSAVVHPSRPRRWIYGVAAVLLAAAVTAVALWRPGGTPPARDRMTIAVLPFQNLSGDPDQDYFSDGITEEMISELGMLDPERLGVIGRTTTMLYKGAQKSIGQIGKELGVTYVLDGSVRRAGSRVRITAQLVQTGSMTNLWSQSYDRDVTDVLSIQRDVAHEIARSLALALAPPTTSAAAAGRAPASFAAYELLMRGRFFREQATEDGARRAIDHFERAIALDPNYAAAHAALADAYRLLGAPGWEVEAPSQLLPRAKTAAERALALDPGSPDARAVLAMVRFNFDWDLPGAEREIKEALRLNPSFARAHQYYSGILTTLGRRDEAIAAAQRAMELDPLSPTASTSLGVRYYYADRHEEAIAQYLKTLEVTPGFAVAHWGLAQSYREQGRLTDHLDQLQSAVQLSGDSAYMRANLAYGLAVAGDRPRAETIRRELIADAGAAYLAPYHLALIAAGLGETEEALRWLDRAFTDRSGWLVFLPVEPTFRSMRQMPAFQQLLARVQGGR